MTTWIEDNPDQILRLFSTKITAPFYGTIQGGSVSSTISLTVAGKYELVAVNSATPVCELLVTNIGGVSAQRWAIFAVDPQSSISRRFIVDSIVGTNFTLWNNSNVSLDVGIFKID